MLGKAKLEKHHRIVTRMSEALDLDLEVERQKGAFAPGEMEDAVLACTHCDSTEACATWLTQQDTPVADAPEYCRNRSRFAALKAAK
ncbi:DUF6455 family protein [Roseivivax sp. CAU 1753]